MLRCSFLIAAFVLVHDTDVEHAQRESPQHVGISRVCFENVYVGVNPVQADSGTAVALCVGLGRIRRGRTGGSDQSENC